MHEAERESRKATPRRTAIGWFYSAAARNPGKAAVSDETGSTTYGELAQSAGAIAAHLVAAGVSVGDSVVLAAGRGRDAVAAVLGIAAAGGVYVPLDAAEPPPRVAAIVGGSGASVALVDDESSTTVSAAGLRAIDLAVAARTTDRVRVEAPDLAYILFTSGSTGKPKGVEISHHNLSAFVEGSRSWARLGPGDVMACFHAFTFDTSVWEIWGALTSGAELVLVPPLAQLDTEALLGLLGDRRVTRLCQTPTALRQLSAATARRPFPDDLRSIFVCGERLDFQSLKPLLPFIRGGRVQVWNMYGPTEATVYSTGHVVTEDEIRNERRSLIGTALPHVSVRVNGTREEGGEIWIVGDGVGVGYRGGIEESERFGWDEQGVRLFRTGDLARVVDGGELEFIGRDGGFVKIRGYRIEPDEVATALCSHPAVVEAAAVDVDFLPGGVALAAAVVVRADAETSDVSLRRYLVERLPVYMRPARIVRIDRIPRLPSMKLDRPALRSLIRSSIDEVGL